MGSQSSGGEGDRKKRRDRAPCTDVINETSEEEAADRDEGRQEKKKKNRDRDSEFLMCDVIGEMLVGAVSPKTRPVRKTAALPGFYRAEAESRQAVQHLHTNTWQFDCIVLFER